MLAAYPGANEARIDERAEIEMMWVTNIAISPAREIRSELNIKPGQHVPVLIGAANKMMRDVFEANLHYIKRLTRASEVSITAELDPPKASVRSVFPGGMIAIPFEGLVDIAQERMRQSRKREKLQKEAAILESQLSNGEFLQRAPADKVDQARARVAEIALHIAALDQMLEALQ